MVPTVKESVLRDRLIEQLKSGELRKIVHANSIRTRDVEYFREIGNGTFLADILVSLRRRNGASASIRDTSFVAIEVKISDWKQGLYQAWRYQSFADKSYLALHKHYAHAVDLNEFQKYNVGLLIFDEDEIQIPFAPEKGVVTKWAKEYGASVKQRILQRSLSVEYLQPAVQKCS